MPLRRLGPLALLLVLWAGCSDALGTNGPLFTALRVNGAVWVADTALAFIAGPSLILAATRHIPGTAQTAAIDETIGVELRAFTGGGTYRLGDPLTDSAYAYFQTADALTGVHTFFTTDCPGRVPHHRRLRHG